MSPRRLLAAVAVTLMVAPSFAQDVSVCLITKTDTNPFFVKMKEGARAKAAELGIGLTALAGREEGDNEGQIAAIESCIARRVDGILLAPTDSSAIVDSVRAAHANGILVIALDTPLDPIDAADATFATDNFKAGELIGAWARAKLGAAAATAKIAYLNLMPSQPTVDVLRNQGFMKGFGIALGCSGLHDGSPRAADPCAISRRAPQLTRCRFRSTVSRVAQQRRDPCLERDHLRAIIVKASTGLLAALLAVSSLPLAAQPPPGPPPPPCTPAADVVCGQQAPEDLVALGSQWVAAGAYSGTGGVVLIRVSDRTSHTAYPSATAVNRYDAKTYPDCPEPPGERGARFTTHGVYVEPGVGPVHKLFVVGHGARESIEVFEVDTRPTLPAVTWLGCVIAPDPIGLNSVRGLPDGGFITTNFLPRGGTREATQAMLGGAQNGELWEWHTATGWQKVPGSEAAGANGVELSADGKTLYVAAWGSQSFFRVSRGVTPPTRDEIPLGFRVDNIHWARDGSLFAVGQAGQNWKAVKIDPNTLAVRDVVSVPDTPEFGAGTALVEVGDQLWVGSFRGNRIAIVPAP